MNNQQPILVFEMTRRMSVDYFHCLMIQEKTIKLFLKKITNKRPVLNLFDKCQRTGSLKVFPLSFAAAHHFGLVRTVTQNITCSSGGVLSLVFLSSCKILLCESVFRSCCLSFCPSVLLHNPSLYVRLVVRL